MGRREGRRNRHSSYTTQQVALPLKQPRLTSDPPRFSPRTKCERLGGDSHASHQSGRGHQNDQDYADCKDDDEGQQLLHLDAGAGADVDDDDDDDGDDDDGDDDDDDDGDANNDNNDNSSQSTTEHKQTCRRFNQSLTAAQPAGNDPPTGREKEKRPPKTSPYSVGTPHKGEVPQRTIAVKSPSAINASPPT